jgi:mRNA-degrading endonuclease RelE of RelBE toxin-antitoxin system
LIDRKRVSKNWKQTFQKLQKRIESAIKELPQNIPEIQQFLEERPTSGKKFRFSQVFLL